MNKSEIAERLKNDLEDFLQMVVSNGANRVYLERVGRELLARLAEPSLAAQNAEIADKYGIDIDNLPELPEGKDPEIAPRSCNRHSNCNVFDANYKKIHGVKFVPFTLHCHDETCEDCFGS